ncbi:MAG: hypothetical protein H6728_07625 [Myxococcales bacterium]|nr:hypothetical protein [Myxococcales bacterium]MCB9642931.1 hypothetical protein [Myxococcales bacterium]
MSELSISKGKFELGPEDGWLHLNTWKQGLLSRLGHDLLLSMEDFSIHIEHADGSGIRVEVKIPKDAFSVLGPDGLSAKDKTEIQSNIKKHLGGDLAFSGEMKPSGGGWQVEGRLRLGAGSAAVKIPLTQKGTSVSGKVRLSHAALGIKPFKAPLGLIQLKDEVDLSFQFDIAALLA